MRLGKGKDATGQIKFFLVNFKWIICHGKERSPASIFAAGTTATSPAWTLERLIRCVSAATSRSATHAAMHSLGATCAGASCATLASRCVCTIFVLTRAYICECTNKQSDKACSCVCTSPIHHTRIEHVFIQQERENECLCELCHLSGGGCCSSFELNTIEVHQCVFLVLPYRQQACDLCVCVTCYLSVTLILQTIILNSIM